jgi:putative transposase
MPRRKIHFLPGSYYHLYNRGHNRQTIFFERENYLYFLCQFRHYLVRQTLHVTAYCLMPNHYHFLVCLRDDTLSAQMGLLSLSYTKAINQSRQRCGGLFQGPFQAILVDREDYRLSLSRYIHLNPVQAGLVQRPEDWEFSSYQDYVEQRQGTLPQWGELRQQIGSAQDYRAFVESGEHLPSPMVQHLMLDE